MQNATAGLAPPWRCATQAHGGRGMELYVAPRAPNPRRVTLFIADKGIGGIELVNVNLGAAEHFA
jgi:hypothetical protein